jgi:hypothetical protein
MTPFPNLMNLFPFAGGNWQTIDTRWWSPNIAVNFAGNAGIEREVNEDVASYGRQIGWLNDIVAALATAAPDAITGDPEAQNSLNKLKAAQDKIEEIKRRRKASALDSARDALEHLGVTDKDAYRRFVGSLDPNEPPGRA